MRANGLVTLLTDFGLGDGYVAAMKGVLLGLGPRLVLVDVSHLVPPHDVVAGAFVLATVAPCFPEGTVHLAVVDPGVGTERAAVALETDRGWLVGPDNGLLGPAAGSALRRAVRIERAPGADREPSPTFHGRDLFAPAAAHLATGGRIEALGPEHGAVAPAPFPAPVREAADRVSGTVVHLDRFGNAVTTIGAADLPGPAAELVVEAAGARVRGLVRTYGEVEPGASCALVGSSGLLELAVREGSAAGRLGLRRGDAVVVRRLLAGSLEGE